jgi:probable phosphoglycerate mutase
MKIYLARHGRTNYNDLEICNADPSVDVHLTDVGIEQAQGLANTLKDIPFDRIFVSELKRTLQTAEIINNFHNADIEVDPRLNDIYSQFEGRPFKEYMQALDAATNRWTASFNDGESIEDIKVRAADFITNLRVKGYGSVLVVTSEWIIRAMLTRMQHITNEEAWKLGIQQGGYIELEI